MYTHATSWQKRLPQNASPQSVHAHAPCNGYACVCFSCPSSGLLSSSCHSSRHSSRVPPHILMRTAVASLDPATKSTNQENYYNRLLEERQNRKELQGLLIVERKVRQQQQHSTIQHNTIQHNTAQHNTTQHTTTQQRNNNIT